MSQPPATGAMIPAAGFRSGFVAVVGRPNVGKSTLVNALVGQKVAIVSGTPQTTRNRIAGVVNGDGFQLVLMDLPGFQKPRDRMTERMQATVNMTLAEVDLILLVLNAAEKIGAGDSFVAGAAFAAGTPVITALNKIDAAGSRVLPQLEAAAALGASAELFPISASRGDNLVELKQALVDRMAPGPMFFPEDVITDQPEQRLVAELIREQAVRLTREEVPHALAVEVRSLEPRRRGGLFDVEAVILVEHDSQKGIIIGKGGKMIREIGERARGEIEALLGCHVFLDLKVKVKRRWRDDERMLDELGL
ncbi:MAG: GTPase Era [Actinomycetota bacterium]|nr:GTPase Era [Actinomycetota bacterium]MCL6093360.1 GTPase Era [Actinomycetota bacterium]MDA8167960.1 GTPase Era [Actinomycetota bacterium]